MKSSFEFSSRTPNHKFKGAVTQAYVTNVTPYNKLLQNRTWLRCMKQSLRRSDPKRTPPACLPRLTNASSVYVRPHTTLHWTTANTNPLISTYLLINIHAYWKPVCVLFCRDVNETIKQWDRDRGKDQVLWDRNQKSGLETTWVCGLKNLNIPAFWTKVSACLIGRSNS